MQLTVFAYSVIVCNLQMTVFHCLVSIVELAGSPQYIHAQHYN